MHFLSAALFTSLCRSVRLCRDKRLPPVFSALYYFTLKSLPNSRSEHKNCVFLRALLPSLSCGMGQATHPQSRAIHPDTHPVG